MGALPKILVVDDDKAVLAALELGLRKEYRVVSAADASEARALLQRHDFAVIVCDQRMPGETGIELLSWMREVHPAIVRILLTGYSDEEDILAAVNSGQVFRYLVKPWSNSALKMDIRNGVELHRVTRERDALLATLQHENASLRARIEQSAGVFISESSAMQAVLEDLDHVATSHATVLILGESGTGKELLARRVHQASPRCNRPFVAVNCGALSKDLIESELFGHTAGAFTGARARVGMMREADGGTLFLDEIGDLSLDLQTRLLRVLENGEVRPVGADRSHKVDLRVLAATHRDLDARVKKGSFRLDLLHRLKVFVVRVPPLRQRRDDIETLTRHFLGLFGKRGQRLHPDALAWLQSYAFPGNVRELRNLLEGACLRTRGKVIGLDAFPIDEDDLQQVGPPTRSAGTYEEHTQRKNQAKKQLGDRLDRLFLETHLRRAAGNVSQAGRDAGISRTHLHAMLKRLGIEAKKYKTRS